MRIARLRLTGSKPPLFVLALGVALGCASLAGAHPLGNFTINHYARLEVNADRVAVRCVVDMAEIPAFQELQTITGDADGIVSEHELTSYGERAAAKYAAGILIHIDGQPLTLKVVGSRTSTPPGAGNLKTLRMEFDLVGSLDRSAAARRLRFENTNYHDRLGWREIVVSAPAGISIFDSRAYANGVTDELKSYPEDSLSSPLNERSFELSFVSGTLPAGTTGLLMRDGRPIATSRDRLAELIAIPEMTPIVALLGLLSAAVLGAIHALSPGHGKTVVGAYLVGSRGTPRHAVFLGLTVTITHTLGVFALGVVTLIASRYIVPERLFPILSVASGAIVLFIGASLFLKRLRSLIKGNSRSQEHNHHHHDHTLADHTHDSEDSALDNGVHSHGGRAHTHLPDDHDGPLITWRNLLALGISGGLLPCPSALVVLLSAISLHRVGYGLLLVVVFSLGLATTLTAVGLAFLYAGRLMKGRLRSPGLVRVMPVVSAFVIAAVGAAICYEALAQAGVNVGAFFKSVVALFAHPLPQPGSVSTASMLILGLVFGLKHAIEADHIAAVTTIASQRKSILGSALVGGLWGLGHSISLFVAGIAVLFLRVQISGRSELALEFGVGLMLIALGANAIRKLLRGSKLHMHVHEHGPRTHVHPHSHHPGEETAGGSHHRLAFGLRPVLVGMVHGLAGSAALMLLVLSTISSPLLGLGYIAVFGIGSIAGMLGMSTLVSLPVHVTATRFNRAHFAFQLLAGVFSLGLGLVMVYEIGFANSLFG